MESFDSFGLVCCVAPVFASCLFGASQFRGETPAAVDSGPHGSRTGAQRWGTAVGSGCFGTLPGELIRFQKMNIFSLLICCPVSTLGPKKCSDSSDEHEKAAARSHDGERGGCSVLVFALKAAELIINADKIMARMTKPLLPHSKS